MNRRFHQFLVVVVVVFVVLAVSFVALENPDKSSLPDYVLELKPPLFVGQAYAGTTPLGEYLDSEAGISAYYDSGFPINLNNAANAFRTIETQTEDYIIGSVAVPYHVEHFDPHVYVHVSGWIMAYYFRADPISKIIDVRGKTINSTLLKTVVGKVATAAGVPFMDVAYYDFRYPSATNMIFVAEDSSVGDNTFTIKVPGTYGYYERGWAVHRTTSLAGFFKLNGVSNPNIRYSADNHRYGIITASQLLPDMVHSVEISASYSYGVMIIIYREQ
jgi:hypothetical protein